MKKLTMLLLMLLAGAVQAAEGQPATMAGHGHHGNGMGKQMSWTSLPLLKPRMRGESRATAEITLVPQNIVPSGIQTYSNERDGTLPPQTLAMEMAGAKLGRPAHGGFHWLAAREESGDAVRVASTVYYHGERGAENPTAMFMRQKHELEIIPQPYPREHSRYRAGEEWKFLVRFNGQPLPGQEVMLETSNGSKAALQTDAQGVLLVHVPDDFKVMEEDGVAGGHDHGRRAADLVLATEHAEGGRNYLTAFNSSYGPNAFDQRSLAMGLGFTLLGMLGATPLLRKRKAAAKSGGDENA